jgi:predicted dehydrogenase
MSTNVTASHARIRWGILGAARIAVQTVGPAIQRSEQGTVVAIASRELAKAQAAARLLDVPRAYGSYEELLEDPEVDAIYIPLPNHLHVRWSIRAMEAGKHVLCEKPLALSADEARSLRAVQARTGRLVCEAFMVRSHPQWTGVRDLMAAGRIGELRLITGHFSYHRIDPADVRNVPEWGGGALMDVGCYPIVMSRWLFGAEPTAVIGQLEYDPTFGVDRIGSVLMRFPNGQATFSCGGQLVLHQRLQLFGTTGRIDVPVPFNPPPDEPAAVYLDHGRPLGVPGERFEFPPVNQFALQADRFAVAIRGAGSVPMSLDDSIANMAVIDAVVRSVSSGRWESPAADV